MLDSNKYLIEGEITVLIDPGLPRYLNILLDDMRDDGFEARDIDLLMVTHLHVDHYGAISQLKELSGAKIIIHPLQKENYSFLVRNVSNFLGMKAYEFREDAYLGDKLSLRSGGESMELIHTPGHSPESFSFYLPDEKVLISGDVIFDKSIGRTDLPGGDGEQLKNSIENLSLLDVEILLPGHMGIVRGKRKVEKNFEFIRKFFFDFL